MATTYRIRFNDVEEQAIECTLTDETGDLDIIDIEGAEDAIRIVSQDNDESKYSPIKAKKCVIKFLNSQSVNVRTFSIGEDNRWLVDVKINSLIVFVGHLEQGDIEEPFQYELNQIVTLTATDGLGTLKTHRLDDTFNLWSTSGGCGPNENRIIDYIANCLGASGLSLTINVINNLREIDNPATDPVTLGNIYAALYLDIKAFEDQKVGQYLYAYDVLERILGHDCYLTQAKGMWWIIRVTELRQDFNMTKTVFDFNGTLLSAETLNYEKAIGLKDVNNTPFGTPDASAYFSQDQTMLALQRPVKYVSLNYNFQNPFEILNNAALLRGAFITDLPDEVDPDGNTLTVKAFNTDCWEYQKFSPTLPPVLVPQDSTEYTKVRYLSGVEFDRFIHFDPTATWPATYQLTSLSRIPTGVYDKFVFSMSFKWSSDLGGAKPYVVSMAQFRLYGDDGSFWAAQVANEGASTSSGFWMQTDSDFIALVPIGFINVPTIVYAVQEGTDLSSWINATFNIPSAPRSGRVEIVLWFRNEDTTAFSRDMSSLNLEYLPYINGSYNIFNSQSDTSTRDGVYYSSIEDEVFITNAPSPIMKGALLKPSGGQFVVVGKFYEGQQYDETTGPDHLATYGELRVRAYHNQFRNGDEIYRLTAQGLSQGAVDADGQDDHQDIIHRYFNRDIEPSTNNQAFQLCNQDVDLRNCEWTGTMIKNFDLAIGFVVDTYLFTYGSAATGTGGGSGGGGGSSIPPGSGGRFGVAGEDALATQSRNFDADTFNLIITGTHATDVLQVQNTSTGAAIKGVSTSGLAIFGVASTGVAGQFNTTSGTSAIQAFNAGGQAASLAASGSSTNTVITVAQYLRQSSGTPADGIGGSFDFFVGSSASPNGNISNQFIFKWTIANESTRTSQAKLTGILSAASVDMMIWNADGSVQMRPITATQASAITPAEGMSVFVNSTNGTFTSIGYWDYENGAWHKR